MSTEDLKKKYSSYKSGTAQTQRIAEAEKLKEEERYEESFQIIFAEAENGNEDAYLYLAPFYEYGVGTEKNIQKAIETYKKAAVLGNPLAQFSLAELIYDNKEANKEKAIDWYRKAHQNILQFAEEGNAGAQYMAGRCCQAEGNKDKAVEWFKKSAAQGNEDAKNLLEILIGRIVLSNGTVYEGDIVNRLPHGKGKTTYPDGSVYEGDYIEGKRHGKGKMTCSDGFIYEGGYADDKEHGKGKVTQADGKVDEGYWVNGDYQDSEQPKPGDEEFKTGTRYSDEKNYKKAVEWFKKAAALGNADAQNELGDCYYYGEGVKGDEKAAVEWYLKAAQQGHDFGLYNLANCYYIGAGVAKNLDKAREWYSKTAAAVQEMAEKGAGTKQYILGVCLERTNEYDKALEWYNKSADQGFELAQKKFAELNASAKKGSNIADQAKAEELYERGMCYFDGDGVKLDYKKAFECFKKAAEMGHSQSQMMYGSYYFEGEGVEQDKQKAIDWYLKAAAQGNLDAYNELGICYYFGYGVEKDEEAGIEWYRKAAEQGHEEGKNNFEKYKKDGDECFLKAAQMGDIDAQFKMGELKCFQYRDEGAQWFLKAAQQGHTEAQYITGNYYYTGYSYSKDYAKALEWYDKAAKQGHEKAQGMYEKLKKEMSDGTLDTEDLYNKGKACKKNKSFQKAAEYFTKAMEHGHIMSMYELGKCYYDGGTGFPRDENKAFELVSKAAQSGDWDVMQTLGDYYKSGVGTAQDYEKALEYYNKAAEINLTNTLAAEIKECQKELKKQKGLFGGLFGKK